MGIRKFSRSDVTAYSNSTLAQQTMSKCKGLFICIEIASSSKYYAFDVSQINCRNI